jgi:hypothetical protein
MTLLLKPTIKKGRNGSWSHVTRIRYFMSNAKDSCGGTSLHYSNFVDLHYECKTRIPALMALCHCQYVLIAMKSCCNTYGQPYGSGRKRLAKGKYPDEKWDEDPFLKPAIAQGIFLE